MVDGIIDAAARRPRPLGSALSWVAIYTILVLAWIAAWAMDPRTELPAELRQLGVDDLSALCLAAAGNASPLHLWLMWASMSAAMMLPTAVPALRAFSGLGATVAARDPDAASPFALPALATGYLAIWFGFAILAAGGQLALSASGFLDPGRDAINSPGLSAALLLLAGAWQFTPLKDACLSRCRAPTAFFIASWRPGARHAYGLGLRLGLDCLGCCWALMLLAFVGGFANLLFMGCAMVLMLLEKLPEIGRHLTRPVGFMLISAGIGLAASAIFTGG